MLTRLLASAVFALSAGMAHADKLTVELNKFEEVEGGGDGNRLVLDGGVWPDEE